MSLKYAGKSQDNFGVMVASIDDLAGAMKGAGTATIEMGKEIEDTSKKAKDEILKLLKSVKEKTQEMYYAIEDMGLTHEEKELNRINREYEAFVKIGGKRIEFAKWREAALEKWSMEAEAKRTENEKKALGTIETAYNNLIRSMNPVVEKSAAMAAAQKVINDALRIGIITAEEAAIAHSKLAKSYAEDAEALQMLALPEQERKIREIQDTYAAINKQVEDQVELQKKHF